MRKLALISTFCDRPDKLEALKSTLEKLNSLGIDSMIITPIELPFSIIKMASYCFVTKDNPIVDWPEFCRLSWNQINERGIVVKMTASFGDYGFAGVWQVKKLSQIGLTFDYDRYYHIIYDLVFNDTVINAFIANDLTCNVWPYRIGDWESAASLHLIAVDRENLIRLDQMITREQYVSHTIANPSDSTEHWFVKRCLSELKPVFEKNYISDSIKHFAHTDHFNFSKHENVKIFIQKCNENEFDIVLLVYGFSGEKKITVRTNLGEESVVGMSPISFTLAKKSDLQLTTVQVEADDVVQELISDIRKIKLTEINFE